MAVSTNEPLLEEGRTCAEFYFDISRAKVLNYSRKDRPMNRQTV